MKAIQKIGIVLTVFTLLAPLITMGVILLAGDASAFDESTILGVSEYVRYYWVVFIFIVIGVLSIIVAMLLDKRDMPFKKNLIIASICLPILLDMAFVGVAFRNFFSYDDLNRIQNIERTVGLSIPEEIKVTTVKNYEIKKESNVNDHGFTIKYYPVRLGNVSYIKLLNDEEIEKFEKKIKTSGSWRLFIDTKTEPVIPQSILEYVSSFDYFIFYNITTETHFDIPTKIGTYDYILVAYDCELHRLVVLEDCKFEVKRK